MAEEIFDIVDDNDEVVGQLPRKLVHQLAKDPHNIQNVRHRSISFMIFRDESRREVYFQKRSSTKDVKPNCYDILGGHVTTGQSYDEAAFRELQEEAFGDKELTEDVKKNIRVLFKIKKDTDNDPEFKVVYELIDSGDSFVEDENEVASSEWNTVEYWNKDMDNHPEKYTETAVLLMQECIHRKIMSIIETI